MLAALLLAAAPPGTITRVDPLAIADDDFARHRERATWRGLRVERITFTEERATWRLWRIAARKRGPLWFVPHDDENAGFDAALVAVRRHGGTIVAVDSGLVPGDDGRRRNSAVAFGRAIDPNRNFHDGLPRYPAQVLASLARGDGPIIALHTNSPGYNIRASTCPRPGDAPGEGVISIRFCSAVLTPSPSRARRYPFDDDDSVAFATFLASKGRDSAYCGRQMAATDFNVVFERVTNSDGSLSNYAALRGLAYLNFETQERGLEPTRLADARDRLSWMIDRALALCPAARPRATAAPRSRTPARRLR